MTIQLPVEAVSEEAAAQAQGDVSIALELFCQYQKHPTKILSEWAGASLTSAKENLGALLSALRNPDPKLRRAGLLIIEHYWPELEELVSECLSLGFHDPDPLTRGIALHVLSRFYGWIYDPSGMVGSILWSHTELVDAQTKKSVEVSKESSIFRVEVLQQRRSEWRKLIGSQLDEMLRSRTVAEHFMLSSDSNLRYVAVAMMSCDWKHSQGAADIAEGLAVHDSDARVRKAAVAVLAGYYAGTKNQKVAKELAEIVSDDSQPTELRFLAYQGLFQVQDLPPDKWPLVAISPFRVPQDIDWQLVASLR